MFTPCSLQLRIWKAEIMSKVRAFVRRHWQRALRIREKLRFSEEAFHLVLAGGVGVIGGLVNLVFHHCIELSSNCFSCIARANLRNWRRRAIYWERLLIPTVGGLVAGLVLYWGLRLVGKQRSSNILEVVATSDGRLPFRTAIVKAVFLAVEHRQRRIHRAGRGDHATGGDLRIEVGATRALAALSVAVAGGVRRGFGNFGGVQRADHGRGVCGADRAGKFFDEPVRAAGVFLGGGVDGVAEFFWIETVVCGAAV